MFVAVIITPDITNMSLQFSLTDGTPLTTTPGFPDSFTGTKLPGATASHIIDSFGHIVLEETATPQMTLSKMLVHWKKSVRIKCQYNYLSPVLFSRAMSNNSMCEVVKGAGDVYLQKNQFSVLTGRKWSGLIISEKSGEHHFTNFAWNADFVNSILKEDAYFNRLSQTFQFELPERLTTTNRDLTDQMKGLLDKLVKVEFGEPSGQVQFEELMTKYLKLLFHDLKVGESVRRKMTETDWFNINKAKKMIDYNLDTQFTTTELSIKVGVNEYKLKKLFPKIAGYPIEEYRKYRLLVKTARKIVQNPDSSIKMFSEESGYESLATFSRAFRRMGCTPGELREETWDLKKLENYIVPQIGNSYD